MNETSLNPVLENLTGEPDQLYRARPPDPHLVLPPCQCVCDGRLTLHSHLALGGRQQPHRPPPWCALPGEPRKGPLIPGFLVLRRYLPLGPGCLLLWVADLKAP